MVGTVVDSAGSTGKKVEYNGQQYDYVFDVDIAEGQPPLKLPFNLNQNPFDAARQFLEANELPITYLDEVVNFIKKSTGATSIGEGSGSGPDPYGTESRYRPGDEARPGKPKVLPQQEYLSITVAKHDGKLSRTTPLVGCLDTNT
jgi:phospholipase A-2-activating protein